MHRDAVTLIAAACLVNFATPPEYVHVHFATITSSTTLQIIGTRSNLGPLEFTSPFRYISTTTVFARMYISTARISRMVQDRSTGQGWRSKIEEAVIEKEIQDRRDGSSRRSRVIEIRTGTNLWHVHAMENFLFFVLFCFCFANWFCTSALYFPRKKNKNTNTNQPQMINTRSSHAK